MNSWQGGSASSSSWKGLEEDRNMRRTRRGGKSPAAVAQEEGASNHDHHNLDAGIEDDTSVLSMGSLSIGARRQQQLSTPTRVAHEASVHGDWPPLPASEVSSGEHHHAVVSIPPHLLTPNKGRLLLQARKSQGPPQRSYYSESIQSRKQGETVFDRLYKHAAKKQSRQQRTAKSVCGSDNSSNQHDGNSTIATNPSLYSVRTAPPAADSGNVFDRLYRNEHRQRGSASRRRGQRSRVGVARNHSSSRVALQHNVEGVDDSSSHRDGAEVLARRLNYRPPAACSPRKHQREVYLRPSPSAMSNPVFERLYRKEPRSKDELNRAVPYLQRMAGESPSCSSSSSVMSSRSRQQQRLTPEKSAVFDRLYRGDSSVTKQKRKNRVVPSGPPRRSRSAITTSADLADILSSSIADTGDRSKWRKPHRRGTRDKETRASKEQETRGSKSKLPVEHYQQNHEFDPTESTWFPLEQVVLVQPQSDSSIVRQLAPPPLDHPSVLTSSYILQERLVTVDRFEYEQEGSSQEQKECAARLLQEHWRMRQMRKNFRRLRSKAVVIQTTWRGHSQRVHYWQAAVAAHDIQSFWRRRVIMRRGYEKDTSSILEDPTMSLLKRRLLTTAALKIQAIWRSYSCLCRLHAKINRVLREQEGAIAIQTSYRRYIHKKRFSTMKLESALRKADEMHQVRTMWSQVTSWWRTPSQERKLNQACSSATRIQAAYRAHVQRRCLAGSLRAATRIQQSYRSFKQSQHLRQVTAAAAAIQTWWRRLNDITCDSSHIPEPSEACELDLMDLSLEPPFAEARSIWDLPMRAMVTRCSSRNAAIQAAWRGYSAKRIYGRKRRRAVRIQAHWRSYVAQTSFVQLREAVVLIQSLVRRRIAAFSYRNVQERRSQAARMFQKLTRKHLAFLAARRRARERMVSHNREIESLFWDRPVRSVVKNYVFLVIVIQAGWRGYQGRLRAAVIKRRELATRQRVASAVLMQSCWRRMVCTREFRAFRVKVILAQGMARRWAALSFYNIQQHAILVIQSHCRRVLACRLLWLLQVERNTARLCLAPSPPPSPPRRRLSVSSLATASSSISGSRRRRLQYTRRTSNSTVKTLSPLQHQQRVCSTMAVHQREHHSPVTASVVFLNPAKF